MKEKSPAFQIYPKDFLSDENVAVMNLEETGAYIRLILHCWTEGSIPSDHARLALLLKVPVRRVGKLWPALAPCFVPSSTDRLIHPRLDKERAKQERFRVKMSLAGKRSGVSRKKVEGKPNLPSTNLQPTPNSAFASADKADALGNQVPERRAPAFAAAPGPKLVELTGTQVEQRRREMRAAFRGEA